MKTLAEIGVAIVGTGFMSWVHVEALRRVGVRVVGICGSTPNKSQAAAEQLGVPKAYAAYADVLHDAAVHSVHIVTPNRLHFSMARKALLAGKHVLCEKPLAMTSAESAALETIASARPRQAAAVNYNMRAYPLCQEAKSRVQSGECGEVFHITGSYTQDWLARDTDYNWRVLADEGGALRAVADIGTHWLDLVQAITGRNIIEVCADLKTVYPQRFRPQGEVATFSGKTDTEINREAIDVTTEDFGAVLLKFADGSRGVVHVSQVEPGRKNCLRWELAGAKQSLAWNSECPNELWIGHRDQPNETLLRDPALLSPAALACTDYPGGHNEGYAATFKHTFRLFYESIQRDDLTAPTPFPTFADGHREIRLCEAILESHQQRRWVSVEEK